MARHTGALEDEVHVYQDIVYVTYFDALLPIRRHFGPPAQRFCIRRKRWHKYSRMQQNWCVPAPGGARYFSAT